MIKDIFKQFFITKRKVINSGKTFFVVLWYTYVSTPIARRLAVIKSKKEMNAPQRCDLFF